MSSGDVVRGPLDPELFDNGEVVDVKGASVAELHDAAERAWAGREDETSDTAYLSTLGGDRITVKRIEAPLPVGAIARVLGRKKFVTSYAVDIAAGGQASTLTQVRITGPLGKAGPTARATRTVHGGQNMTGDHVTNDSKLILAANVRTPALDTHHENLNLARSAEAVVAATAYLDEAQQVSADSLVEGAQLAERSEIFGFEAVGVYRAVEEALAFLGVSAAELAGTPVHLRATGPHRLGDAVVAAVEVDDMLLGVQHVGKDTTVFCSFGFSDSDMRVNIRGVYDYTGRLRMCRLGYVYPESHENGINDSAPLSLTPSERALINSSITTQVKPHRLVRAKG